MELTEIFIPSSYNPISSLITNIKNPKLCIIETHGGIVGNKSDVAYDSNDLLNYCLHKNFAYLTYNPSNNGTQKDQPISQVLFSKRVNNLINVISYVTDKFICPVVLIGTSLGGLITINAAAQSSKKIIGLVINCGVIDPEDTIKRIVKKTDFENWQIKNSLNVFEINLPYSFLTDIKSLRTEENLKSLSIPILWFHGENDELVPITQINTVFSANPTIELIAIKNGGHRFGSNMQKGEWEQTVEGFIKQLIE